MYICIISHLLQMLYSLQELRKQVLNTIYPETLVKFFYTLSGYQAHSEPSFGNDFPSWTSTRLEMTSV